MFAMLLGALVLAAAPPGPTPQPAAPTGMVEGTLLDRELEGYPVEGGTISLQCSCLASTLETTSDDRGQFELPALPPGVYTVLADRGGPPTRQVVALGPGQRATLELRVAPPITSDELERRDREEAQARTMIAIGGILEVAALAFAIAAGAENAKPECKFELDDCASAPRPRVAVGLGIGAGVFAAGGGALIGVGALRLRRLRARIAVEDGALTFLVGGRF